MIQKLLILVWWILVTVVHGDALKKSDKFLMTLSV